MIPPLWLLNYRSDLDGAFDPEALGTPAAASGVVAASVNPGSIVTPAGATIVVVGVGCFGENAAPTGVTLAGNTLSAGTNNPRGSFHTCRMFYLVSPPAGTNPLVITFTGTTGGGYGVIASFFRTNEPGAHEDEDNNTAAATSLSVNPESSGSKRLVVSFGWLWDNNAMTESGTGHVELAEIAVVTSGEHGAMGYKSPADAGTHTVGWSGTTSGIHVSSLVFP